MEHVDFFKKNEEDKIVLLLDFLKQFIKSCAYEAITDYEKNKRLHIKSEIENDDWLSPESAKKLLGIKSKSKLQQLRDNGEILFSQHGRIIKYSKKSILNFLNRNVVNIHLTPIKKIRA